jgi:ABC-type branched-subunit amino acid transport system substrate-binding protein
MLPALGCLILAALSLCNTVDGRFTKYPKYSLDLLRNKSRPEEQYVIRMAAAASMSSTDLYFHYGKEMTSGYDLFTNWVNLGRGGIDLWGQKYTVVFDYIEDFSNKSSVNSIFKSMLSEYDIFHAPYSSSLTRPAVDITDPAGKLMIASAASTTSIFVGRRAAFATISSNNEYLESSMGAFKVNGATTVAVIKDIGYGGCGDTYEDSVNTAKKHNLTLHGYFLLDSTSSNYSGLVLEVAIDLKANNIETVVGCSYTKLCADVSRSS